MPDNPTLQSLRSIDIPGYLRAQKQTVDALAIQRFAVGVHDALLLVPGASEVFVDHHLDKIKYAVRTLEDAADFSDPRQAYTRGRISVEQATIATAFCEAMKPTRVALGNSGQVIDALRQVFPSPRNDRGRMLPVKWLRQDLFAACELLMADHTVRFDETGHALLQAATMQRQTPSTARIHQPSRL